MNFKTKPEPKAVEKIEGKNSAEFLVVDAPGMMIQSQAEFTEDYYRSSKWSLRWCLNYTDKTRIVSGWLPALEPSIKTAVQNGGIKNIEIEGFTASGKQMIFAKIDYDLVETFSYMGAMVNDRTMTTGISVRLKDGREIHVFRCGNVTIEEGKK